MSFTGGFEKIAKKGINWSAMGGALKKGLGEGAKQTVGDTAKLKGLGALKDAYNKAGGLDKMFTTAKGRQAMAHGLGKAAPSLAVGGAYAYGAKKVYDKMSNNDQQAYY